MHISDEMRKKIKLAERLALEEVRPMKLAQRQKENQQKSPQPKK